MRFQDVSKYAFLAEAGILLAWSYLLVKLVPFVYWCRLLGEQRSGAEDPLGMSSTDQYAAIPGICWAIKAFNHRSSGHFTCLMQAMAAHWMLGRRQIASSLVLGTRTEMADDGKLVMHAHAWLRVGSRVVLGAHDGRYVAVSSFVRAQHDS